jgi:hypothetical protein
MKSSTETLARLKLFFLPSDSPVAEFQVFAQDNPSDQFYYLLLSENIALPDWLYGGEVLLYK